MERSLDLFERLVFSGLGLTLSEISRELRIAKSSSHRLIQILEKRGYLQRMPDGHRYILGRRARDLGAASGVDLQLQAASLLQAQKIAKKLGLTVLVAVRSGVEGIAILKVESPNDSYPGAWVGHHFDLHCTALGKALLAHLPQGEIEVILGHSFPRYTPFTVTDSKRLLADLAQVRARGFSVNNEELTLGGRGVAAPIVSHIGGVVASIGVRGSINWLTESRVLSCGREVASAAIEISRHLWEALPQEAPLPADLQCS